MKKQYVLCKQAALLMLLVVSFYRVSVAQEYPTYAFQQEKFENLYSMRAIDVAIHPSNSNILFVTTMGGVYKSENGGEEWIQVTVVPDNFPSNNAEFWYIHFNPENEKIMYTSDASTLYKSIDGGDKWEIVFQGVDMRNDAAYFTFAYKNPDVIYVAGHQGIWKTENAGSEWKKIRDIGGHIRTGSDNTIAVLEQAGENNYFCVSTDDFTTVDTLAQELPPYAYVYDDENNIIDSNGVAPFGLTDMVLDYYADDRLLLSGNDGILFESNNKGETWKQVNFPGGFVMQTDPKDSAVVYAGSEYEVYKSVNRGVSWSKLHNSHNYRLLRCDISPSTNEAIFVGNLGLEYMNQDGDWSRKSDKGIQNFFISQIFSSQVSSTIVLFDEMVHLSNDAGDTWSKIYPATPDHFNGVGTSYIGGKELEISDDGNNMFLTGWAHHNGTLFRATSLGGSWKNISPYFNTELGGLTGLSSQYMAVNPNKPDTIYVGATCPDSCVFLSVNGGEHWKAVNTGIEGTIGDMLISHKTSKTAYAISDGTKIYKTADAGENWTLVHNGSEHGHYWYMHMNPHDANEIIAVRGWTNYISRTTDGGETWQEIDCIGEVVGAPVFDKTENGMVYYFTISGDLHKSTDTLKTWVNLTGHISHATEPKGYTAYFKEGDTFLAGIARSSLYALNEFALDSTVANSTVNCVYDSTASITMYANKTYPEALYSIDKGQTTQSENVFNHLPTGSYFPIVILGTDTLSYGSVEVSALQNRFVDLGSDVTMFDTDTVTLDAGDAFESYKWNDNSTLSTLAVYGPALGVGSFNYWVETSDEYSCLSSDSLVVEVKADTTSALGQQKVSELVLYPNPVKETLFIKNSSTKAQDVLVYDNSGKPVLRANTLSQGIDVSTLLPGIYFVRIDGATAVYQFIKQ